MGNNTKNHHSDFEWFIYESAAALVLVVGIIGFLVWLAVSASDLPTVQESWSRKECVRVVGDGGYSCENLPAKYNHAWVE